MATIKIKANYFSSKEQKVTSVYLPVDMIEALHRYAEKLGMKQSTVIREVLDQHLSQEIEAGTIPAPKKSKRS